MTPEIRKWVENLIIVLLSHLSSWAEKTNHFMLPMIQNDSYGDVIPSCSCPSTSVSVEQVAQEHSCFAFMK